MADADIPDPPPVPLFLAPTNEIIAELVRRSNALNKPQGDDSGFFSIKFNEGQLQIAWASNVTLLTEDYVINGAIVTGISPVILSQGS